MSETSVLTEELLAVLPDAVAERLRAEQELELEARLAEWLAEARRAWPQFSISSSIFLRYLAVRIHEREDVMAALAGFHWGEVYLACACGRGDREALDAFERHYLSIVPRAIAHIKLGSADIEEVMQGIREKLFVKDAQGKARIDEYAGGGSMHGLVKVMAVRAAISMTRRQKREHPDPEDRLLRLPAMDLDPELASVKQELRAHFKEAFAKAAEELAPRERNLLRMHLLDGVTLGQLAINYSVHRATVTRWLASARQSLLKNTRKHLADKIDSSADELDDFVGLVESRIDLSYRRLLKTDRE